jgi:hypothetical protein
MTLQMAHHCIFDDDLARIAGDELNRVQLPLPIRRFMEFYGGTRPIDTLQRAVRDLMLRYRIGFPSAVPVRVEHLCEILGIRLAGKPPACTSRSHPSYAVDATRSRVGHTGMLRIEKSGPVVVIPDDVDRETAKVSVAHEIGHFLLHWRGHQLDEATIRMPADPIEEALAEYAARLLLLPQEIWSGITPITNLAEYAITQCGLAGVTINSSVSRLGDPDLSGVDVRGAIFWRMQGDWQRHLPVNEQISPHWFRCPGAFIPVNRSKARPGSLVADLAGYEGTAFASRVEQVRIGTLTGTYIVDGYAWGSLEEGRRVVLTVFRPLRLEVELDTSISNRVPNRPEMEPLPFGSLVES